MNNERSLNDARLDRAIDRAVREIVQVDPAPGLRRRVLSRINAPVERRTLPLIRYGFAGVALAVIVAAVSVTLQPGQIELPAPPRAPAPIVAGGVPPVVLPDLTPTAVTLPGIPNARGPVTMDEIAMPSVANVFGGQRSGVEAANVRDSDATPRSTARIDPETLAPLTIVPMSARPIVIEPLVLPAVK